MTEKELISGCKRHKEKYQEALVKKYSPMLMTVCRRYATDGHMAYDILQETLIKILKAIPKYRPTGSFESWMRRIAITTSLKYLERKWWKREVAVELSIMPEPVTAEGLHDLEAEDVLKLVRTLPNGFRQIFNLYVIEGYSHQEIGALLGISESTSRSQLARARKLLQKQILIREKLAG